MNHDCGNLCHLKRRRAILRIGIAHVMIGLRGTR